MPLVRRSVYPTNLCLQQLPENGVNELEMVTNNALAGVIAQLSDLSRHAEDLFGELTIEATNFTDRARLLGERVTQLNDRISLEAQGQKQPPITNLANRDIHVDQQVVARNSLPQALKETYQRADRPPPLNDLQKYRDDGKEPLKMYTNPDYFFELWREQIQKEAEAARNLKREKRRRQKLKLEHQKKNNLINHRPKEHDFAPSVEADQKYKDGVEFVKKKPTSNINVNEYMDPPSNGSTVRPNSGLSHSPHASSSSSKENVQSSRSIKPTHIDNNQFPAPPVGPGFPQPPVSFPIPPNIPSPTQNHVKSNPIRGPPVDQWSNNGPGGPPPPPPPGPPPAAGVPLPPPAPSSMGPPSSMAHPIAKITTQATSPKQNAPQQSAPKQNLLKEIQDGKKLRKVALREDPAPKTTEKGGWVESIDELLERRRKDICSSDESASSGDDDWSDD